MLIRSIFKALLLPCHLISNSQIFFSIYFQAYQAQTQHLKPSKHPAFKNLHNLAIPQDPQIYFPPSTRFWYQPCQAPHCLLAPASAFLPKLFISPGMPSAHLSKEISLSRLIMPFPHCYEPNYATPPPKFRCWYPNSPNMNCIWRKGLGESS